MALGVVRPLNTPEIVLIGLTQRPPNLRKLHMRLRGASHMHIDPAPHVDPDRLPKLEAAIGDKKPVMVRTNKRTKKKKRKRIMPRAPPPDAGAFTIEDFCALHRLSRAMYYKLKEQDKAPREIRLGTKVLISREAAAEWRREREAEAAA